MENRWTKFLTTSFAGIALAGLAWTTSQVEAQDQAARNARNNSEQPSAAPARDGDMLVLIHPTGDRATSSLLVEAVTPAEVPVGKSFEYTIRVTNLTDNLVLEDVKVRQTDAQGLSIENATIEGRQGQNQDGAAKKAQNKKGQNKKAQNKKGQGKKAQNKKGQGNSQANGPWTINRLGPGESRTIRITATGDKEGLAQRCIRVSYEPALCLATRFVHPEIAVGKSAPEEANICRPLELRYVIKNSGTGVARDITIRDELPEGLKTREAGEDVVTFDVGDLAAGQEREFRTTVVACSPGSYASRAVAKGEEVESRSNRPETKIVAAKLAVDLQGPDAHYVDQPITYQATVRNEGDAPSLQTELTIDVDDGARVMRMSKSNPGNTEPERSGRTLTWDLGELKPGAERKVSYTISGRRKGTLEHQAVATAYCEIADDCEEVAAMNKIARTVSTDIMTLPALVLEMVDQHDPVKVGDEEVYTIVVRNQGTGPDNNVQIKANLPDNFEFVSARGTTEVKSEGNKLTFEPIEQLESKEKAEWQVRVKATSPGDVRNKIELTSEYLDQPVPEYEPTRVIE